MNRNDIRTVQQALYYITECTLATVDHMNTIKSKSKSEFDRQVDIAQIAVNNIIAFAPTEKTGCSRLDEVMEFGGDVSKWIHGINSGE